MHARRPGDVADQANDGLYASGRHGRPDPSRRPGAEVGHAGAPGARPAALPPYRRREGVSSALGPRGWRKIVMDVARGLSAAPGPPGRPFGAGRRSWGIAKGNALGSGPGGAWRSRRRGVAQARGNCAIVRNVGFRTRRPAARGEVQAAAWRIGWVGAARPTGICALVHNISQAWGSNPPAWSIFKDWGTPQGTGWIRGLSLGRTQRPSRVTIRRHKGYPALDPQAAVSRRSHSRART